MTTNIAGLVARLKAHGAESWAALMDDAATALEDIARERDEAERNLYLVRNERDNARDYLIDADATLAAAEAEVSRLKEALEQSEAYWGGKAKP